MSKQNVHIVPHENGWAVRREENERASSVYPTKQEATDAGRTVAKADKVELVIHNQNGQIADRDSYGNDPFPPRDTRH